MEHGIIRTEFLINVPAMLSTSGYVTATHGGVTMFVNITQKRCTKCGETKSLSNYGVSRKEKDNLTRWCKSCISASHKAHYTANKEKLQAKSHAQFLANPEYYRNAAREREARLRLESADFRKRNYDKAQRWIKENPDRYSELMTASNSGRRARIMGAEGQYTTQEWMDLKKDYDNHCVYCGRKMTKLTADHVEPLKLGGNNSIDNIAPSCKHCNLSKNATPLLVWMWRKLTGGYYG
jgi:hypothetical protein